jgi:hypothetical protein
MDVCTLRQAQEFQHWLESIELSDARRNLALQCDLALHCESINLPVALGLNALISRWYPL